MLFADDPTSVAGWLNTVSAAGVLAAVVWWWISGVLVRAKDADRERKALQAQVDTLTREVQAWKDAFERSEEGRILAERAAHDQTGVGQIALELLKAIPKATPQ